MFFGFKLEVEAPACVFAEEKPCPHRVGDVVQMSPAEIGFSHFSISAHFRDGNTIASTLRQLTRKEIRKEDIETVQAQMGIPRKHGQSDMTSEIVWLQLFLFTFET